MNRFKRLIASSRIMNFADLQPLSARAGSSYNCVEARALRDAAPAARSLGMNEQLIGYGHL